MSLRPVHLAARPLPSQLEYCVVVVDAGEPLQSVTPEAKVSVVTVTTSPAEASMQDDCTEFTQPRVKPDTNCAVHQTKGISI